MTRRDFLQTALTSCAASSIASTLPGRTSAAVPALANAGTVDIGSRLELFVDDFLIARTHGSAALRLHSPAPREIVLTHDAPWEGNLSNYYSVFRDGDRYRMYYRATRSALPSGEMHPEHERTSFCYAESDDGIVWRKPDLGLIEYNGSRANNIVLRPGRFGQASLGGNAFMVFRDDNPETPADARYKGIGVAIKTHSAGLLAFKSPDGIRWTLMLDKPVITDGAFDSANLAFWDAHHGVYRAYFRYFTQGTTSGETWKPQGYRAIRTAVSKDFLNWKDYANLSYDDDAEYQLYTNNVGAYARAPHLLLAFPTRYVDRGWTDSVRALPDRDKREFRAQKQGTRSGTAMTESLFMSSRDGVRFNRWPEAFIRPGIERPGTWNYGHAYQSWGMVETKSSLPGAPDEFSFYASENYRTGEHGSELRRYTLRTDGFVSLHAPMSGGEMTTRPLMFTGCRLALNFASSAAGEIQIEIQDEAGRALPGHTLDDCVPVFGDSLAREVTWSGGPDLSAFQGKPVRLRFLLRDADIYSMQFRNA